MTYSTYTYTVELYYTLWYTMYTLCIHYDTLWYTMYTLWNYIIQCVSFAWFCGGYAMLHLTYYPCSVEHRRLHATAETRHHHDVCSAAERHRTAEGGFCQCSESKTPLNIGLLLDEFPLFSYDCIFRYVLPVWYQISSPTFSWWFSLSSNPLSKKKQKNISPKKFSPPNLSFTMFS